MTVLSDTDIALVAKNNFGDLGDQAVVIATAIALAESGGDNEAKSPGIRNGSGVGAYGLWQIQTGKDGSEVGPNFYSGEWSIPNISAQAARNVYNQEGWGAWSVFDGTSNYDSPGATGNSYSKYLSRAQSAVATISSPIDGHGQSTYDQRLAILKAGAGIAGGALGLNPGGTPGVTVNPDGTISGTAGVVNPADAIKGIFAGLGGALWIGGGAILVLLGMLLFAKNATPLGAITKVAGKVLK